MLDHTSTNDIVLVTPVWNDSRRLSRFGLELAQALAEWQSPILWVIADDGSRAPERQALLELCEDFRAIYPRIEVFHLGHHEGKGAAVYGAWRAYGATRAYAFIDADGAIHSRDLKTLMDKNFQTSPSAVIGVRQSHGDKILEMSLLRKITHEAFILCVRVLTGLRVSDPQCGVKVISAQCWESVDAVLEERGMAFDSELLYRLQEKSFPIVELPIDWVDKPNGAFNVLRCFLPMLGSLLKIRLIKFQSSSRS